MVGLWHIRVERVIILSLLRWLLLLLLLRALIFPVSHLSTFWVRCRGSSTSIIIIITIVVVVVVVVPPLIIITVIIVVSTISSGSFIVSLGHRISTIFSMMPSLSAGKAFSTQVFITVIVVVRPVL